MKHILFYIVLWLLLSVLSCTGGDARVRTVLAQADSLLPTLPDSALHLLQSLSPRDLPDREGRMYYALLLSHAKYRNYIPLGSDSLLQEVAAYYAGRGDDRLEARARYLLGGVYAERQEADRAFKTYHEAARLARQAQDGRTLCLTLHQWAYLCQNHGMAARGDSLYAETARLARQVGDSVRWAEALLRRGAYALSLGDSAYPRAEQLIGEGYELARRLHSVQLFRLAYLHSVALYIRLRQPEKALIMAKKTVEGVQGNSLAMARASLLVGGTYYQMGHYDSASVYLQRVLGGGDDLLKDSACGLLALISEKEGNWEQALRWKKEQEEVRRQWHALRQEVEMAVAAREVEWSEAERMHAKSRLPMAFYFLLLVGLWICFWEAKAFLCRKSRAGEVDAEAIDAPVEKQETWDYALFKMKMHETDVYASLSGILERYAQYAEYSRHWDGELERAFVREADVLLPGYRMALMEKYPCLDAQDVCLCLFYMLDFTDAQIGVIWELNKSSVIRRRQRILCRKMNSKKTAKEDLLKICMLSPEVQEMHPSQ